MLAEVLCPRWLWGSQSLLDVSECFHDLGQLPVHDLVYGMVRVLRSDEKVRLRSSSASKILAFLKGH